MPGTPSAPSIVQTGPNNIAAGRDIITTNISGYTIEQHEKRLKDQEMALRAELGQAANQKNDKQLALKQQLKEVQGQLATVAKSYQNRLSELTGARKKLEKIRYEVSVKRMEQAEKALNSGDIAVAETLIREVIGNQSEADLLAWKVAFEDNFDGKTLSNNWQVVTPNGNAYVVENGNLLVWSSNVASFQKENIENIFKLRKEIPKGDWRITAKVRIDFQTGNDRVFFGLHGDKDNYVLAYTSTKSGQCVSGGSYALHLYLTRIKATGGKTTSSRHEVWRIPRCDGGSLTALMARGQPILLRMRKIGRAYRSSIMLQGSQKPKWIELPGLTLRQANGNFAFGVFQAKKGEGETSLSVDWIKLETK